MSKTKQDSFIDHQFKVLMHMSTWRQQANCVGLSTDDFYSPDDSDMKKQAVKYCFGCPVQNQCLYTAIIIDERHGVWGGLTPRQRKSFYKKLKAVAQSKDLDLDDWDRSVDNFIFENTSIEDVHNLMH